MKKLNLPTDMNITKEMIQQQASKTELYEDGYKGFINGAEWVLSLIKANKRPDIESFFRQSYPVSEKWDKYDWELHQFNGDDLMDFAERYSKLYK